MKKILALCLAVIATVVQAQPVGVMTSPDLIGPKNSSTTVVGATPVTHSGGGLQGGSIPGYNSSTNTIMMGYMNGTVAYKYAFSQALQNSGITLLGYNYSWEYINQDLTRGSLAAQVTFDTIGGKNVHTKDWTLEPTTQGWTNVSGTKTFGNPFGTASISGLRLSFTGQDDRYWAGYYGPQVRNASLSLNYSFDQCSSNPLSSPDCPGYAVAYHDQQCIANPLYATSCPGYAVAYQTQQCTANPLSSPQCPGYAEAYKTQQCSLNPLYAVDCLGYAQAYFDSQCLKDSLYNTQCPGYKAAYTVKNLINSSTAVSSSSVSQIQQPDPVAVTNTTGNSTVDAVIAAPSTTSVTSPISVVANSIAPNATISTTILAPVAVAPTPAAVEKQAEQKADAKKTDAAVASVEKKTSGDPKAARAEAGAKAKEIAANIAKAATMEEQTAQQGLVVGLIGYVPGFSAYQNSIVPDALGAAVARQYHKPVIDNRAAQRRLSGANEYKWQQMVDSQYQTKD